MRYILAGARDWVVQLTVAQGLVKGCRTFLDRRSRVARELAAPSVGKVQKISGM